MSLGRKIRVGLHRLAACLVLLLAASSAPVSPQIVQVLPRDAVELAAMARSVEIGGSLRLEGLSLGDEPLPVVLELERFEVFAPEARIAVHGGSGQTLLPAPANAYFRGGLTGRPDSLALLTVRAAGGMRGLVAAGGRLWVLGGGEAAKGPAVGLTAREIDLEGELGEISRGWSCLADELADPEELLGSLRGPGPGGPDAAAAVSGALYQARIAIETDEEYYSRFGNVIDAVDYAGDLVAYGSTIYTGEVDTSWVIEVIHLWVNVSDPWQQTSPRCALYEFGRYWNDNRSSVSRTVAHFLSGKNNGGGIAWLGVLCSSGFNYNIGSSCPTLTPTTDNYGGGYGYTGDIDGNFDIGNPTAVWDMVAVAHEIGHNFNSPHTHCYNGIGGNSQPVDGCYAGECSAGCYCGTQSLPASCPGSGNGCGTIMSYCHLLGGGMGNISLTLGQGHPYGIQPERVPQRMQQHVIARAASYPTCLALPIGSLIFEDDFESGDIAGWGLVVH